MLYLTIAILLGTISAVKFDELSVRINQFKNHTLPSCTRMQFNTAYRKIKINIYGQQNIRGILFTDMQLKTDCVSEDIFNECNQQSSFCSYFRQVKQELSYSVGFCSPTVYLYIQNQVDESRQILAGQPPPLKTVSINLQSRYIQSPCTSIEEDKYVKCGSIKPKDCQEKCQFGCTYVKCHQKAYEKERFGLCLPKNLSKQEYMDRCMMESGITYMNVTDACDKTVQRIVAQGQANPVVTLIIISLLILLVSVIYYRFQLRRTGRPPFNPPSICPLWVYPAPPNVIWLTLIVALFWGITNPFLEKAVTCPDKEFLPWDFSLKSFWRVIARIKFLLPFGINQLGSVLYMYVLGRTPAHYCSIMANSMTSVVTMLTEAKIKKQRITGGKIMGILMIVSGIYLILS